MIGLTTFELQCLGYRVEDLGHHPGLEGMYRWVNTHTNEFQNFGLAAHSEAEAWVAAATAWGDKHDLDGLLVNTSSGDLTPAQLDGHYNPGGVNGGGEHPAFTRAGWRHDVGDGATVMGYWVWVASEIEQSGRRAEPAGPRGAGWLGPRH